MDAAASGDWRAQLRPGGRLRVVNEIMDTLKRQFSVTGPEKLDELRKIAAMFEEKAFTAAVNQELVDHLFIHCGVIKAVWECMFKALGKGQFQVPTNRVRAIATRMEQSLQI